MNKITQIKRALAITSGVIVCSYVAMIGTMLRYGGLWLAFAFLLSIVGTFHIKKIMNDFKRIKKLTN